MDGQGTTWGRNIAENFNRLSRCTKVTDQRSFVTDRQTTDGRPMTYSEHELEFTLIFTRSSSRDETANVNFFTTKSYTHYKITTFTVQ